MQYIPSYIATLIHYYLGFHFTVMFNICMYIAIHVYSYTYMHKLICSCNQAWKSITLYKICISLISYLINFNLLAQLLIKLHRFLRANHYIILHVNFVFRLLAMCGCSFIQNISCIMYLCI